MYTNDEVAAAVEKLVRTSTRSEYGALGNRRLDLAFTDLQDAAAGVFLLKPNAVFYVVKLAAERLQVAVAEERAAVAVLIAAIRATGRFVRPVTRLTPLQNAKVALDALTTAAGSRSRSLSSIESVQAYQRFSNNLQLFLDLNRDAIVVAGDIAETPSAARASLVPALAALESQHQDTLRRVRLLEAALEDFDAINLPVTLSQQVLTNARDVLEQQLTTMVAQTDQERLLGLRGSVLALLAARAAVRGLGALSPPTTFLPLTGTGAVFADVDHPAAAARLISDLFGPYTIVDAVGSGVELNFVVDGQHTLVVQLTGSFVTRLEGAVLEPFDVYSTDAPPTHRFVFGLKNWSSVGGEDQVDVTFSDDHTKSAYEVCAEINAAIIAQHPTMPVVAEPYANPLRFFGSADIDTTPTVGTDADLVSVGGLDWTTLGLEDGDTLIVRDVTSAYVGRVFSIDASGVTADRLGVTQLFPAFVDLGTELAKTVEIGGQGLAVRIRITTTDDGDEQRVIAVDNRYALFLPTSTVDVSTALQFDTATTFGLLPGIEFASRPVRTDELVRGVTNSFAVTSGGIPRLSAEVAFVPNLFTGQARTEVTTATRVVLFKFRGVATVTPLAGTNAQFDTAAASDVEVGDTIVVRSSVTVASVDMKGIVTAATATQLTASMDATLLAETGVEVEVGPTLGGTPFEPTLRITDVLNGGDYVVKNVPSRDIPFELVVEKPLVTNFGPGNLPLIFDVELGQDRAVFVSADTSLSTRVVVDTAGNASSAAGEFFSSLPASAVGVTPYFQLTELPAALEGGDQLELYTTTFDIPDVSRTVARIEKTLRLVELSSPLSATTVPYTFSLESPVPFGRIRKAQYDTYDTLRAALTAWLQLAENQMLFFGGVRRLLNPLLVSTNPTPDQVNNPVQELVGLSDVLASLTATLQVYQARPVEAVDTLVSSFLSRGADRAVDLLLEGQFSTFFGLSVDDTSYAGAVQKATREVEREDLPIRKTGRTDTQSVLFHGVAAFEDIDYEFDQSDVTGTPRR